MPMSALNVNNPPKLLGILGAMVILGILMALRVITGGEGMPLMALLVGYLVGNGVAAKRDQPVEPVLTAAPLRVDE